MTAAEAESRPVPRNRIVVVDYHMQGPAVRVPSREADAFQGHLHGWLYRLQGADPDERPPVDPDQPHAPFSAWLLPDGRPSSRPGVVDARVCWLSEERFLRALRQLADRDVWLLGTQPYRVVGQSEVTRRPVYASQLLDGAEDARTVRISTRTPTGFRRHTRWHVSLAPEDVLQSIIARWRLLWPETLPEDCTDHYSWTRRIAVSSLEMRSVLRSVDKVQQMCGTGSAEWDLYPLREQQRRLVMALLRGGELFGVGSRTAYGLGAIRAEARP